MGRKTSGFGMRMNEPSIQRMSSLITLGIITRLGTKIFMDCLCLVHFSLLEFSLISYSDALQLGFPVSKTGNAALWSRFHRFHSCHSFVMCLVEHLTLFSEYPLAISLCMFFILFLLLKV